MATPSPISSGVGFRHAQVLLLDANGNIQATSTNTAYTGITIQGAKSLTINDPESRQIVHTGDDNVFALDSLPSQEPMSGELRSGKQSDTLDAALTGVNAATVGESSLFPLGTNQRGNENQVAIIAYRQALDTDDASVTYGKRLWQIRLFPKCQLLPRESGFDENPEDRSYTIRPQFVTSYPWGIALQDSVEGATRAQGFRGVAEFKPKIAAYQTNNTVTQFTLPVAAQSVNKIKVYQVTTQGTGSVSTPTTSTTSTISYTTAPTTGTLIVWYETE